MEKHCYFESSGSRLLGVIHEPEPELQQPLGLVYLHGWAGYRIGPHQMFTKMARQAARRGFVSLRFDFRGRGDSEGETQATTLTTMIEDAVQATDYVSVTAGLGQVALIGDCSGSEVALGAGPLHPAVQAMVLWSAPIVGGDRTAAERAKRKDVLRQYLGKIWRRESWAKLFSARLQLGQIARAVTRGGQGTGEEGAAVDANIDWRQRFMDFRGERLFVYGGNDPTTPASLQHYEALCRDAGCNWNHYVVPGANHAFYSLVWEQAVIDQTLNWLETQAALESG